MSESILRDTVIAPMPIDQVFKEIYNWLNSNRASVIEEIEPVYIKAYWKGNTEESKESNNPAYPEFLIPFGGGPAYDGAYSNTASHFFDLLHDSLEKNIIVRIKQHTNGSSIEFEISQVDPRHKGKGLLYWGSKLEIIYNKLGVTVTQENLENLYRTQIETKLKRLVRNYLIYLLGSLVIVLVARSRGYVLLPINPVRLSQWDILLWYFFIVFIPLTSFFAIRYGVYYPIKKRLR